ncbi:MAG: ubiquinone/menaquinone biosynthesis methyltransferase [Deltaproteobacteria bacterium]|nr:ubiquinone/menaquinone biosynthesis methyltransferase [Deltaproteobacteria bacterium]
MTGSAPVAGDPGRAPAVRAMFARIAPGYDRANDVMSLGIARLWRRLALRELGPSASGDVLDLCAGTMDFSGLLAPSARSLTALDFCAEMLEAGRHKAPAARVVCADAREMPFSAESFDAIVAGFGIRNVPEPERAVREAARVLRPGGVFVVVDFFRPTTWLARLMDRSYNRLVLPIVGRLVSGDAAAYQYLADSMGAWTDRAGFEYTCLDAGFASASGRDLFPPIASIVVARKS